VLILGTIRMSYQAGKGDERKGIVRMV